MQTSEFVEHVEADLAVLRELSGPDLASTVDRLVVAARPVLRDRFLEAVNTLIQEFNAEGADALCLTLEGGSMRLARAAPKDDALPQPPMPNELNARIALRVSEEMKREFERFAQGGGISVNSWIVRTLDRALRSDHRPGSSQSPNRLKGVGRA